MSDEAIFYNEQINNKRDIVIAWMVALLIHALFFSLSGKMFLKPSQFVVAPSREIDINLVEEPKQVVQVQEEVKPVIQKVTPEKNFPKPVVKGIEKPKQLATLKALVRPRQIMPPSAQVKVEARPDYVQNPPPPYPELAKQMGQEGLVLLSVDVDSQGDPLDVQIIQSCGHRMLDEAALKAVQHWKFQPGRIGDLSIESKVTVPIRFRLE